MASAPPPRPAAETASPLMSRRPSKISKVVRGLLAGAAGTLAKDLLMYRRYRRDDGPQGFSDWELSSGLDDWDDAGAPAQVGKRLYEGLFRRELSSRHARLTSNVMHWSYGMAWGGAYGVVAAAAPPLRQGLVLGPAVWISGYIVLPLLKLYKPIWEYDAATLAKDLSAHLLYGVATTAAFRSTGSGDLRPRRLSGDERGGR